MAGASDSQNVLTLTPEQIQAIIASPAPAYYLMALRGMGAQSAYDAVFSKLPKEQQTMINTQLADFEKMPDVVKQSSQQAGQTLVQQLTNPAPAAATPPPMTPWQAMTSPGLGVSAVTGRPVEEGINPQAASQAAAQQFPGIAQAQQQQQQPAAQAPASGSAITQAQVEANTARNMPMKNMGKPQVVKGENGQMEIKFTQEQLAYYTDKINENAQRAKMSNPQYNPYVNPDVDPSKIGLDRLRGPAMLDRGQVDPATGAPKYVTLEDILGGPKAGR